MNGDLCFYFPFLLFLSTNLFANQITNATDFVYDKNLTNYKYFSKVHKFQFISQGISLEMAMCTSHQIKNTKEP